jgi:hypothetical protein
VRLEKIHHQHASMQEYHEWRPSLHLHGTLGVVQQIGPRLLADCYTELGGRAGNDGPCGEWISAVGGAPAAHKASEDGEGNGSGHIHVLLDAQNAQSSADSFVFFVDERNGTLNSIQGINRVSERHATDKKQTLFRYE